MLPSSTGLGRVGVPRRRGCRGDFRWFNLRDAVPVRWPRADDVPEKYLQQVSTVAGDGDSGLRDGAAAQARFDSPEDLALLPDVVCWWRTATTTASAC